MNQNPAGPYQGIYGRRFVANGRIGSILYGVTDHVPDDLEKACCLVIQRGRGASNI